MVNANRRARRATLAVLLTAGLVVSGLASFSAAAPSRSELQQAKDRLMELERDFELVVEDYNATHEELASLQSQIGKTALEVRAIETRMRSKEKAAVEVAVELYKSGRAGALEAVLSADSLAEMESRLNYLSSSEKAQARIFESLASDRTELEGKIADLEEARAKAAEKERRLASLRDEIDAKLADQKDEIADLTAAIERAERRAAARAEAERQAAAEAAAAQAAQTSAPSVSSAPSSSVPSVTAASPNAQVAVDAALSKVGAPYAWGAAGPDSFDCSGLTMWAWAQAGVSLPHNSGMQYSATPRVAQSDLQPGDLLFFGSPIHHVGMYIGNGQMVESPYTGLSVRVTAAFRSDYVGAGRPGL